MSVYLFCHTNKRNEKNIFCKKLYSIKRQHISIFETQACRKLTVPVKKPNFTISVSSALLKLPEIHLPIYRILKKHHESNVLKIILEYDFINADLKKCYVHVHLTNAVFPDLGIYIVLINAVFEERCQANIISSDKSCYL